jgi:hypothetical protein
MTGTPSPPAKRCRGARQGTTLGFGRGVVRLADRHHSRMLRALEARYLAVTGQMREFDRAVGLAHDSYEHADPANDPDWVQFFDASEFCATIGICHHIAAASSPGHADTAELIGQAISSRPAGRVRSRAFNHIGLARTRLIQREYESAATARRYSPRTARRTQLKPCHGPAPRTT